MDPDSCGTDSLDDHTSTADTDDQTDMVIVSIVDIPLSLTSIQRLSSTIDPLQHCTDFGKQLYLDRHCQIIMVSDGLC